MHKKTSLFSQPLQKVGRTHARLVLIHQGGEGRGKGAGKISHPEFWFCYSTLNVLKARSLSAPRRSSSVKICLLPLIRRRVGDRLTWWQCAAYAARIAMICGP